MPFRDAPGVDELSDAHAGALRAVRAACDKWDVPEDQRAWLTDETLLRFLRARRYEAPKATDMLRNALDFRISYRPQEVRPEGRVLAFAEHMSYYFHMTDANGHPVCYMRFRRTPESFTVEETIRHIAFVMEEGERLLAERRGDFPHTERFIFMIDLAEFSLRAPGADISVSKKWGALMSEQYPERLSRAYLVNYPYVFSMFWKMVTVFMDKVQVQKVQWVPKGRSREQLREYFVKEGIPAAQLEYDYGGDVPGPTTPLPFAFYREEERAKAAAPPPPSPAAKEVSMARAFRKGGRWIREPGSYVTAAAAAASNSSAAFSSSGTGSISSSPELSSETMSECAAVAVDAA